jgi:predicted nucleic acid-binding protein
MRDVIDTSTAFQWEVPEPDSSKAIRLRDDYRNGVHDLVSPDIFPAEGGNALIVAERNGRITSGQFAVRLAAILASCPHLHETRPLVARACLIIASVTSGFRLSFYDALYVALAEREGCELISGDDRLVRNMAPGYPFVRAISSI